jgi:hypothetical protein
VTDINKRLEALEIKMNAQRRPGRGFRIILVGGCFTPPGEVPAFANCGALAWLRNPGEELEAFATRCAAEVPQDVTTDLIIGGLPRNEEQYQHAMVDYDRHLADEGGVPPVTVRAARA